MPGHLRTEVRDTFRKNRNFEPHTAFEQMVNNGFAVIELDFYQTHKLMKLYSEAAAFFSQEESVKLRYGVADRTTGYRPHKYAHSGSAEKPDFNDSFLYWKGEQKSIPNSNEVRSFLTAAEEYRAVAEKITTEVIEDMRSHYDYQSTLTFAEASVLQINSFGVRSDDELLQHPHEDAVFLTVISANADGLEGVLENEIMPLSFKPNEVIVMPGSIMTDMTGGEIRPFYHQARNHGVVDRKSIMYFVSPDVTDPVFPFVINDQNHDLDIRDRIINNPQQFGLSENFIAADAKP